MIRFVVIGLISTALSLFVQESVAHAAATDRYTEIHQHKVCGPVPWEAFQVAEYGEVKAAETDVNAKGKANVLTQSGEGSIGVKNNHSLLVGGKAIALPITGEEWMGMYMAYMRCTMNADVVTEMWEDALNKKVIKNPADIQQFFSSAEVLTNPRAPSWWKEFQVLMEARFDTHDEELKKHQAAIDAAFAGIAQLREDHDKLFERVEKLEAVIAGMGTQIEVLEQQPSADEFVDDVEALEQKQEALEERVEKIQEELEDLATEM